MGPKQITHLIIQKRDFCDYEEQEKSHHQVRCASLFISLEEPFGCLCVAGGGASQAAGGAEIMSSGAQRAWDTAMQPKLCSWQSHPGQSWAF